MAVVVRMALAAVLALAAGSKLRSPRSTAAGLATFGVPVSARLASTFLLAAVEGVLAVGVALASAGAAYAAAALLATFGAAVAAALLRGREGAPCGCFGAHSRVGRLAFARNLVLAAAFAVVPSLPQGAPTAEGWLLLGLVVAFVCIGALTVAVLALAREVGVLRLRLGPEPALDMAGEGPAIGTRVALPERLTGREDARLAVAIFSSEGCRLCQALKPVIAGFRRDPLVAVEVFDEVRDAGFWDALRIPGSPFAVAFDGAGEVYAKGTFNTYGQLESILATAERRLADARA